MFNLFGAAATRIALFAFLTSSSFEVYSQSTPAEFAEMSLQDLFSIPTDEAESEADKWSWSLRYQQAEFDGYLDGTHSLSLQDVLFTPGEEARTDSNFPVVPTVIVQRATILGLQYQWRPNWHFNIALPHVQQETDHISVVPGYEQFLLKSDGIGDVSFAAQYFFAQQAQSHWKLNFGISVPTGSIDERGDTPRASGEQQLPYTMQLGSGTWDFPVAISYRSSQYQGVELDVSATFRSGKNDRNYRLGNRYSASGKYRYQFSDSFTGNLALRYTHINRIAGADESLLVPLENPYPASITNPDLYGGSKLFISAGMHWQFSQKYNLSLELAKPLYQNLNGPQPKETWRAGLAVTKAI